MRFCFRFFWLVPAPQAQPVSSRRLLRRNLRPPASLLRAPNSSFKARCADSQNQSYVKAPFLVPAGTERVTITFDYTGKEQHTALDLGLLDPS